MFHSDAIKVIERHLQVRREVVDEAGGMFLLWFPMSTLFGSTFQFEPAC